MEPLDWHRSFGIALIDYFTDSNYSVDIEKDLSLQQQFLDMLIIRQDKGKPIKVLPDGLENLSKHNLLTYKSLNQPLDTWAIQELEGHYVSYRKAVSPSLDDLLPESDFELYGISTRYPQKLETEVSWKNFKPICPGVYEVLWGGRLIRIIVLSEMPMVPRNALWQLFSGDYDKVFYGQKFFDWHIDNVSSFINQLLERYQLEGINMPYTMENFRDKVRTDALEMMKQDKTLSNEFLKKLSPDERLKGLPADKVFAQFSVDERLKGLAPDERLKGLAPDERLKGLAPDERLKGLPPDERLKGLPPDKVFAHFSPDERLKGLPADKVFAHFSSDERLKGLAPDERLKGLPLDVIQEYLSKHQKK